MILQGLKNYYSAFSSKDIFLQIINLSSFTLASLFIFLINFFRPLLGPGNICPFELGCTQFAILQLQTKPLTVAIVSIAKRLLSCNPVSIWMKHKKACSSRQN